MMSSTECHALVISARASAARQVSWYIPQSLQTSSILKQSMTASFNAIFNLPHLVFVSFSAI